MEMDGLREAILICAKRFGKIAAADIALRLLGLDASELEKTLNDQPRDTGGCFSEVEGAICTHKKSKSRNVEKSKTKGNPSGGNQTHNGSGAGAAEHKGPADEKEICEAAKNPVINQKGMAKHANKAAAEKAMRDERSKRIQENKIRASKGLPQRNTNVAPKSYFIVDQGQVARHVMEKLRKGDFYVYHRDDGRAYFQVDLGYLTGKTYNEDNTEIDTYTVAVIYSRREGFHFCPTKLAQDRRKANI